MALRNIPIENELSERVHWFVKLRWFAAASVLLLGFMGHFFIKDFQSNIVVLVAIALLLYNFIFSSLAGKIEPHLSINLQIVFDWVALTMICYSSGGPESPFLFFFIFHVILASLFISRKSCIFHGIFAILLIFLMSLYFLHAHGTRVNTGRIFHQETTMDLVILLLSFSLVIFLAILLSTSVVNKLRAREEKLVKLQEDLRETYEGLIEADKAKTNFVYMITHEIRGPLAAVQSLIKVVQEGFAGEVSEKAMEILNRAEKRTIQLLNLVNELLDLVRGAQKISEEDKDNIDIEEAIHKIVDGALPQAREKSLKILVNLDRKNIVFQGDIQDIERIFQNLIQNAIKYSPDGREIKINGSLVDDNLYLFRICDQGIGIPKEEQRRIFDEFYRAGNAKRIQEIGTGLGLSIVKKTVEKYGGRVEVDSEQNKGSCFSVYLPVKIGS